MRSSAIILAELKSSDNNINPEQSLATLEASLRDLWDKEVFDLTKVKALIKQPNELEKLKIAFERNTTDWDDMPIWLMIILKQEDFDVVKLAAFLQDKDKIDRIKNELDAFHKNKNRIEDWITDIVAKVTENMNICFNGKFDAPLSSLLIHQKENGFSYFIQDTKNPTAKLKECLEALKEIQKYHNLERFPKEFIYFIEKKFQRIIDPTFTPFRDFFSACQQENISSISGPSTETTKEVSMQDQTKLKIDATVSNSMAPTKANMAALNNRHKKEEEQKKKALEKMKKHPARHRGGVINPGFDIGSHTISPLPRSAARPMAAMLIPTLPLAPEREISAAAPTQKTQTSNKVIFAHDQFGFDAHPSSTLPMPMSGIRPLSAVLASLNKEETKLSPPQSTSTSSIGDQTSLAGQVILARDAYGVDGSIPTSMGTSYTQESVEEFGVIAIRRVKRGEKTPPEKIRYMHGSNRGVDTLSSTTASPAVPMSGMGPLEAVLAAPTPMPKAKNNTTQPIPSIQKTLTSEAADLFDRIGVPPIRFDLSKPVQKLQTILQLHFGKTSTEIEKLFSYRDEETATVKCTLRIEQDCWTCEGNSKANAQEQVAKTALIGMMTSHRYFKLFLIKVPPDSDGNPTSTLLQFFQLHSIHKQGDELQGVYRSFHLATPQPQTPSLFECKLIFKSADLSWGRGDTKRRAREQASRGILRRLYESLHALSVNECLAVSIKYGGVDIDINLKERAALHFLESLGVLPFDFPDESLVHSLKIFMQDTLNATLADATHMFSNSVNATTDEYTCTLRWNNETWQGTDDTEEAAKEQAAQAMMLSPQYIRHFITKVPDDPDSARTFLVQFLQTHSIYGDEAICFQDTYSCQVVTQENEISSLAFTCQSVFKNITMVGEGSSEKNARNDAAYKILQKIKESLALLSYSSLISLNEKMNSTLLVATPTTTVKKAETIKEDEAMPTIVKSSTGTASGTDKVIFARRPEQGIDVTLSQSSAQSATNTSSLTGKVIFARPEQGVDVTLSQSSTQSSTNTSSLTGKVIFARPEQGVDVTLSQSRTQSATNTSSLTSKVIFARLEQGVDMTLSQSTVNSSNGISSPITEVKAEKTLPATIEKAKLPAEKNDGKFPPPVETSTSKIIFIPPQVDEAFRLPIPSLPKKKSIAQPTDDGATQWLSEITSSHHGFFKKGNSTEKPCFYLGGQNKQEKTAIAIPLARTKMQQ